MPGDLNSSMGYLDVQFGAMDLMLDGNAFDNVPDAKFVGGTGAALDGANVPPNTNLDLNSSAQSAAMDVYSSTKPNAQSSISSAITQGVSVLNGCSSRGVISIRSQLPNTDSIPTTEHLSSAYSATASRGSTGGGAAAAPVTPASLDLNKPAETHSYSNQSSYSSYQPKSSSFQPQTYSSSSYSGTQVRKFSGRNCFRDRNVEVDGIFARD